MIESLRVALLFMLGMMIVPAWAAFSVGWAYLGAHLFGEIGMVVGIFWSMFLTIWAIVYFGRERTKL